MREWTDIAAAFAALCAADKLCALATVVNVDGSAYRCPGARMLVAEDGSTWGGVSGGCLERDVADRARGVIATGRPFLHRYDTADDELVSRGVSTGCGGTIDILLQPISAEQPAAIPSLGRVLNDRTPRTIATVIETETSARRWFGKTFDLSMPETELPPLDLRSLSDELPVNRRVRHIHVETVDGVVKLFVEHLRPPQRLVIVGGGPDAVPVLAIAKTLGWRVAIVAAPPASALHTRFAAADERFITGAEAPLEDVSITADCAVVVMTHNLARDAAVLAALTVRPRYLGLLGPRHRTERLLLPLPMLHPARSLHSPVGLDIGSESPEEIALSIIAEVQACVRAADARPLHARPLRLPVPAGEAWAT